MNIYRTKKQKAEIEKLQTQLQLSYEEASELYDFDNGLVENEEVNKLEEKAQENKKAQKNASPLDTVKYSKAKKQIDDEKETILNQIFAFVEQLEELEYSTRVTGTKTSFKTKKGGYYTVTVTKNKTHPNGLEIR